LAVRTQIREQENAYDDIEVKYAGVRPTCSLPRWQRFSGERTHEEGIQPSSQGRTQMLNTSSKSILFSSSLALFTAAMGTQVFGAAEESKNSIRDLRADIAAIKLAIGVLDGKVEQSNADLAIVRQELQQIRETLVAQEANGRLQLEVWADPTSCASGAIQCASAILPSSANQIPVELKFLVLRDHVSVTNLDIAHFDITPVFSPEGGNGVIACAAHEEGCGSPEFFTNRGNGGYQLWVHPPTNNWASGTYSLLLRVTDTEGRTVTKLVNVPIARSTGNPGVPPPVTDLPGTSVEQNPSTLAAAN